MVLGPYVLLDRLGTGGSGQVFKARHRKLNRIVALKTLRPDVLRDPEAVQRFYREIQVAGQLSHPNVVHAHEAGQIGNLMVLVMEYVDGSNLEQLVDRTGPLSVGLACECIRQAAVGLQYAHERGLVHRDIKPSNLLACQAPGSQSLGLLKILDLGLARWTQPTRESSKSPLTTLGGTGMMQGTPDYMAPEQALDFHTADIRADIYSLGCTFYFLLTAAPPFAAGTLAETLLKHQTTDPPPIELKRKDIPPAVVAVLAKMLAKRPPDRYQLPGDVAHALAAAIPRPPKTPVPTGRSRTKKPSTLEGQDKMPSTAEIVARPRLSGQAKRWPWVLAGTVLCLVFMTWLVLLVAAPATEHKPTMLTANSSASPATVPASVPSPTHALATPPRGEEAPIRKLQGWTFDGQSDHLDFPHESALEPAKLTVEAWVNPTTIPATRNTRRWLVNKNGNEWGQGHYALLMDGSKIGAYLNLSGGRNNVIEAWSGAMLRINEWHHLAFTYDGLSLRVYHDGKEVAATVASETEKPRTPGKSPLTLGRRQDGAKNTNFQGKIDLVRIFNRPLTAAEIKAHADRPDQSAGTAEPGQVFLKRF